MVEKLLELDVSEYAAERLSRTARREGLTLSGLLRRALNIEDYLREVRNRGGKVFVVDATGKRRELKI
jgi:hypothetical protein